MKIIMFALVVFAIIGCVTLNNDSEKKTPPAINEKMSNDAAVEAGIEFGGETLSKVKDLLNKRQRLVPEARNLEKNLMEDFAGMSDSRLINTVNLYLHSESPKAPQLVLKMLDSAKNLHRQLAWHIAGGMPSTKMGETIEGFLTQVITDNRLGEYLSPGLADAIADNHLRSSYTILRQGLMETNNVAFAKAMMAVDPQKSSSDFLDYLAQAPVEELRQLNLETLDLFTCMEVLKHLQKYPASIYQQSFANLFLFATSRNIGLAELAHQVLLTYSPTQNLYLSYLFNLQPEWVQLAYVEGVRKNLTPVASLFLMEAKKGSRHQEVVDEINSMIN